MIPHSRPFLGPEEEAAAVAVIRSGQLSGGERVAAFERGLAARVGMRQAVAVSSGTAALHLALLALGVGAGDEVALPSYVCSALLHAVRYTGAAPLLVDVDPETFNLDAGDLRRRVTRRTRAVILPHMFGLPADVEAVQGVGLPVIEDCAMGLGAGVGGRPAGGWGDLAVFSFFATKVIACGEGGMVAARDEALAARARDLRTYDGREDAAVRFNYKLSDLHAAVGEVQFGRLDAFITRRREIAARYSLALSGASCGLPVQAPGHIFFRYVVRVRGDVEGVIAAFERAGVAARRPVFCPLHRSLGMSQEAFPGAEAAQGSALSLPLYPALSEEEVETVIRAAQEILVASPKSTRD
ncbi:MAG: DegT/DnrJ/EryC1/StrS family aminotransferase [Candidatus Latescibacteria bacterium]|nr:DegT/DnrJ/EryC1/StrS family aminotransferase [Candidatus Latescibacterota bacterium]